jgi:alkylhydroperoxidase family enzyme
VDPAVETATGATGDARCDALTRFVRMLQETCGTISQEAYSAIKAAGYTDAQLVEIALAIVIVSFTNLFNRVNDTDTDFPRAA